MLLTQCTDLTREVDCTKFFYILSNKIMIICVILKTVMSGCVVSMNIITKVLAMIFHSIYLRDDSRKSIGSQKNEHSKTVSNFFHTFLQL